MRIFRLCLGVACMLFQQIPCQEILPEGTTQPSVLVSFCNMESDDAETAFLIADQRVANDSKTQIERSILGSSEGNEFIHTESAQVDAEKREDSAMSKVESSDFDDAGTIFDKNGGLKAGTSGRRSRQVNLCIYDLANSLPCNATAFREPTARCTNLNVKTWGMAGTPFTRVLYPRYEDGISAYRTTEFSSGNPLKSPRLISASVTTTNVLLENNGISAHVMQWGQFISHEFTLIGEIREKTACCPNDICPPPGPVVIGSGGYNGGVIVTNPDLTDEQIHFIMDAVRKLRGDVCIPVERWDDPVLGHYVCMHQTRSKISPAHDCTPGPRQQMNMITHVFDGSAVYGSSLEEAKALRTFTSGLLKSQVINGETLPPCASVQAACPFLGGDKRINVTPNLVSYHTLFVVFHNKLAAKLQSMNQLWNDERIYQEARRIVSAVEANIHFYEYLPLVLGSKIITQYGLNIYNGVNSSANPSILNELAGAAMRFGHSQINGVFSMVDEEVASPVDLTTVFFDTTQIHAAGIQQCIKGLTNDSPSKVDRDFPKQMRDQLFAKKNDIVSLNINRGRDHGFASYMDYRRNYGLSVPNDWSGLSSTHSAAVAKALQQVYTTVEDIELYIGGVTENPVSDGLVGATFAHILADGFSRTRNGDRLFFESSQSGLSADQIKVIKGYKLNQLLCEGSDIDDVSSKAFFRIGFNGATEISCSNLPKFDLELWRERLTTLRPTTTPKLTTLKTTARTTAKTTVRAASG